MLIIFYCMNLQLAMKQYLEAVTGVEPAIRPFAAAERKGVPLFLGHLYSLHEVTLFGHAVVLAVAATDEHFTPHELAGHAEQLRQAIVKPLALVLPSPASFDRNRLMRLGVPFMAPGRQLFLPMLLTDLRENFPRRRHRAQGNGLSPYAQAVVLYRLLRGPVEALSLAELARLLGYTPMMLTLAADELKAFGLAEVAVAGRKRHLRFKAAGRKLWEMAEAQLRSPVARRYWVRGVVKTFPLAGMSALEQLSDVTGDALPVHAESARIFHALLREGALVACEIPEDADWQAESWRYSPRLFAKEGCVDRLSLYLSLRDTSDERVRMALDTILENMTWLT